ncbi:MAG: radical SAM protein, partial [Alphaproteobacteria bacterium]
MEDRLPDVPRKGRGAVSNHAGRYEPHDREAVDDGWWHDDAEQDAALEVPGLRTELIRDTSRTIIARNESPDVPFDRSINPYRG